mgnify:CR=1 FL=1
MRVSNHKIVHAETVKREIDGGVDLPCALGLGCRKALEVDNENLGRSRDDDLLGRHSLAFTKWTLPDLVATQHLLLAVATEALIDITCTCRWDFHTDTVECFICSGCLLAGRAA